MNMVVHREWKPSIRDDAFHLKLSNCASALICCLRFMLIDHTTFGRPQNDMSARQPSQSPVFYLNAYTHSDMFLHAKQRSLALAGADRSRGAFLNKAMKLPVIAGVTQDEGTALGAHVTVGDERLNINMAIHGVLLPGGALPAVNDNSAPWPKPQFSIVQCDPQNDIILLLTYVSRRMKHKQHTRDCDNYAS
jgi:hypothetical protein